MPELNIEALKALSSANVATELWHWESPLMGGRDEPMATYPAIDWVEVLTTSELTEVVTGLEKLGTVMADSGVAAHQASDDAIMFVLGGINPSKKEQIIALQVEQWNALADHAVKGNKMATVASQDIDGYLEMQWFRGADPSDAIESAIAKFGEAAIVDHAVAKITNSKSWWDYADHLKGEAYKIADTAYTRLD